MESGEEDDWDVEMGFAIPGAGVAIEGGMSGSCRDRTSNERLNEGVSVEDLPRNDVLVEGCDDVADTAAVVAGGGEACCELLGQAKAPLRANKETTEVKRQGHEREGIFVMHFSFQEEL